MVTRFFREGYEKAPFWLRWYMPFAVFQLPESAGQVYLTLDDGPTPGITDRILDLLAEDGSRATFFCLGQKAEQYPALVRRIQSEGHAIGNHTFSHLNAWNHPADRYAADVFRADAVLAEILGKAPCFFRPPYGRIGYGHWRRIKEDRECLMWDVTSRDFVHHYDATQVVRTVARNTVGGSIILMHDSEATGRKVVAALPAILEFLRERQLRAEATPERLGLRREIGNGSN
jgi:peptidoglycan/xylan/chitin deacetylase (PgdA/CDA1 family)